MSAKRYPKSLREARRRFKRSQSQVAASIGVTRGAVGHWDTGHSTPSGPARLLLAQQFEVPLAIVNSWFPERVAA